VQPLDQGAEIDLLRRRLEIGEADDDGGEAQEAGGPAELIAERGQNRIRPRIQQPQDEQVEVAGPQAEGFW